MSSTSLPAEWVNRLFARMVAIYGSQKVGAMWEDSDIESVKAVWGQALGRFQPGSIGGAIQRLIDSGNGWPPTLPEFVELCRQSAHDRNTAALLKLPPARTDNETAKRKVAELMANLAKSRRVE